MARGQIPRCPAIERIEIARFQKIVSNSTDSCGGGKLSSRCNCSTCTKIAPTTYVAAPADFTLLKGEESSSVYERGGKSSKRFFCKHCGVHCFGRGHLDVLGGDYVSANLNCLDDFDPNQVPVVYFDGRHNNWKVGPRSTPWPVEPAQVRA